MPLLRPDHIAQTEQDVFPDTQGYILISHRFDHRTYGFVRLRPPVPTHAKAAFTNIRPTSSEELQSRKRDRNLVVHALGLSARGYLALGFADTLDPVFRQGFAQRALSLTHTGASQWNDIWEGGQEYDALVVIAASSPGRLPGPMNDVCQILGPFADIVWRDGFVRRDAAEHPVEHFGFADGVSQPVFLAQDQSRASNRTYPWDPAAPLGLVLTPDLHPRPQSGFGSYCAFLTIEQHAQRFDAAAQGLAAAAACPVDHAKAMIVGRHPSGDPLPQRAADQNDFDAAAPDSVWPNASHTRRMNPRAEPHRRILRRGALYENPSGERGLLFQSFQASLDQQFEFIFRNWAFVPNHPAPSTGVDPFLAPCDPLGQNWPAANGASVHHAVRGTTTLRGGQYFFFPSLPWIRSLSSIG
ncbi:MAG: Dyp-type peroxidase [Bryobacteraceae bacterium]|nr:Dyp-type peroxidase [Bryobacteraceae bacterium]